MKDHKKSIDSSSHEISEKESPRIFDWISFSNSLPFEFPHVNIILQGIISNSHYAASPAFVKERNEADMMLFYFPSQKQRYIK